MENNKLYIKNMVCNRCLMAVENELKKADIPYSNIELGVVDLAGNLNDQKKAEFSQNIAALGFELIEDKTARIISGIKNAIIEFVRASDDSKKLKFSVHLSEKLHKDYNYLSNLFSSVEGTTIEQYLIQQKIERVKELLVYDELSLGEIAHQLAYSSVQHLSNQFKKVTGLTPSHFKQLGENRRRPLDKV